MARFGPSLEHRQALLGRMVNEAVDLVAMALTLSRASRKGDQASIELADLFCRHARARIKASRRRPMRLDRTGAAVGRQVLAGRYEALEDGILL